MLIGSGVKDDNYWWERANKEAEERDSNIEIYDIDEMIGEGFSPVIKSMSGATKQDDSDAYEDFNENHIEVESDEVVTSNLVDMNISPKELNGEGLFDNTPLFMDALPIIAVDNFTDYAVININTDNPLNDYIYVEKCSNDDDICEALLVPKDDLVVLRGQNADGSYVAGFGLRLYNNGSIRSVGYQSPTGQLVSGGGFKESLLGLAKDIGKGAATGALNSGLKIINNSLKSAQGAGLLYEGQVRLPMMSVRGFYGAGSNTIGSYLGNSIRRRLSRRGAGMYRGGGKNIFKGVGNFLGSSVRGAVNGVVHGITGKGFYGGMHHHTSGKAGRVIPKTSFATATAAKSSPFAAMFSLPKKSSSPLVSVPPALPQYESGGGGGGDDDDDDDDREAPITPERDGDGDGLFFDSDTKKKTDGLFIGEEMEEEEESGGGDDTIIEEEDYPRRDGRYRREKKRTNQKKSSFLSKVGLPLSLAGTAVAGTALYRYGNRNPADYYSKYDILSLYPKAKDLFVSIGRYLTGNKG